MIYTPQPEQQQIIDAEDPVLVVVGGAGTGKTTTAAAAVRAEMERRDQRALGDVGSIPARALFLSFSRAAVAQILERTTEIIGPYQDRVQITTYHAFAWSLIRRFGSAIGHPNPILSSAAEIKLFGAADAIRYEDLIPFALRLCAIPAISAHLRSRWSLIVCDEFQDTGDDHFRLIEAIRGGARLVLLGDPNQCIYSELPGSEGVSPERLISATSLPGTRQVPLPEVSHRDPSGVLPAAAAAIYRRDFGHEAVTAAVADGRLSIQTGLNPGDEARIVAEAVEQLRGEGYTVGVFSHHIDATTTLSDRLIELGISHEIVGQPESMTAALDAQFAMLSFATGSADWDAVRARLAVFVTSLERGPKAPALAFKILTFSGLPRTLASRLESLRADLTETAIPEATKIAGDAFVRLGLIRGERQWQRAARLLRPLALQVKRRSVSGAAAVVRLEQLMQQQRAGLLTYAADADPAPVQLMGLYQTKGRESDATIVVLRSNDYFGGELSPFPVGSRLLYVVLTRARHKTIVLMFGDGLPKLVAPLAALSTSLAAAGSSS